MALSKLFVIAAIMTKKLFDYVQTKHYIYIHTHVFIFGISIFYLII